MNLIKWICFTFIFGVFLKHSNATPPQAPSFQSLQPVITYWVGSGPDSLAVIITFNSSSFDSSVVWGVLFDGNITGRQSLNAIASDDINVEWFPQGEFLDSIRYGHHGGKNGSNGCYWGIYQYQPEDSAWDYGQGLSAILSHNDVIGFSFTDFSPEVKPGFPIPAYNPHILKVSDLLSNPEVTFFGSGDKAALLIVDFEPSSAQHSFAFPILFDGEIQMGDLLQIIQNELDGFSFQADAFLNAITYGDIERSGGNPYFWGTWSAPNFGMFSLNSGLSSPVSHGEIRACSYTSFQPAERPSIPTIISKNIASIAPLKRDHQLRIFPNPASSIVHIVSPVPQDMELMLTDMAGKKVRTLSGVSPLSLSLEGLTGGCYILTMITTDGPQFQQVMITP
jgi:hypothetical protein